MRFEAFGGSGAAYLSIVHDEDGIVFQLPMLVTFCDVSDQLVCQIDGYATSNHGAVHSILLHGKVVAAPPASVVFCSPDGTKHHVIPGVAWSESLWEDEESAIAFARDVVEREMKTR